MARLRKSDVQSLIDGADPHDGFRVRQEKSGDEISLHLMFYASGVPQLLTAESKPYITIFSCADPNDADYGRRDRAMLLASAMCRFLNTGGNIAHMRNMVGELTKLSGQAKFEIPGFHLMSSVINSEGGFEHVFAAPDSPYAIRWVEDQFIEPVALETIRQELEDELDEAAGVSGAADAPIYAGPKLLGQDDPEAQAARPDSTAAVPESDNH